MTWSVRQTAGDGLNVQEDARNLRTFIEAVSDTVPGLLFLYTEDGRLTFWNDRLVPVTGYTADELANFPASRWFSPEDRRAWRKLWDQVFAEGTGAMELHFRRKDGAAIPYHLTCTRLDVNSRPHLLGIGIDVSDRRRNLASLAQMRSEVSRTGRLVTQRDLGCSLAHELASPLGATLSNAQAARRLLSAEPPDLDEIRAALDDIINDNKHTCRIARSLTALMERDSAARKRLDANGLILTVAGLVHGDLAAAGVALVLQLQPDLPLVEAPHVDAEELLLHLMITGISTQIDTEAAARCLTVATSASADSLQVTVANCGPRIANTVFSDPFEPLVRPNPHGLAMSFATCRQLAESVDGRLWAENNPDRGTTFYLKLPCTAESM